MISVEGRVEDSLDRIRHKNSPNGIIQPLLTDMYQINMAYAYWKAGKVKDKAVFDLFFRKSPFHGEFTIFAGLEQCLHFLQHFTYSNSDIEYLKRTMPKSVEEEFFEFLRNLTAKEVTLRAIDEGKVVFPRVPLLTVEGPLIVVQLLETTLLTLINYASLVATNAARYRMAAGKNVKLLEFGLRRAQGPDGGLTASKYVYIGGFDGTSNVLAGKLFDIPVKGTHAHAFVSSFFSLKDLRCESLAHKETGELGNLRELSLKYRGQLADILNIIQSEASNGELAAFISFAIAFPEGFIALIDTYDVLKSGILNFCAITLALNDLGYRSLGVRIDSGDLAYLSCVARSTFDTVGKQFNVPWFEKLKIVASNDINEETIMSLNEQGHKIDCFGIGTHLVTCQRQPALGCVFKLVEVNNIPTIKLSQDESKITCPGRKVIYRLYGSDGHALIDLMMLPHETPPLPGSKVLCRHPFHESKRAYVNPSKVEALHKVYWQNGAVQKTLPCLNDIRERVIESLLTLRQDHKRCLNPTPYKVGVSDELYTFLHELWLQSAPIGELC